MQSLSPRDVTGLLHAWTRGDRSALDKLIPLVQAELYQRARRYMARERPGHLLQATALINEVYVRLLDWRAVSWQNRAQFFGICARLMRNILVDLARARPHLANGVEARQVPLDEALAISRHRSADLVTLNDALEALATLDPRQSQVVELRFFGGLSVEETAEVLQISGITVIREWNKARAWLYRELNRTCSGDEK